jgi:hypothetical protein
MLGRETAKKYQDLPTLAPVFCESVQRESGIGMPSETQQQQGGQDFRLNT